MRVETHDELGYPLGINFDNFYKTEEKFLELPPSIHNTKPGMYFVSTWGRVHNIITNTFVPRELIPKDHVNRYRLAQLRTIDNNTVTIPIHRLVGETFIIGKKAGPNNMVVINHIDAVRWHNEVYNLEWVSAAENCKHAVDNNLIARSSGENNGSSILTDIQYHEICRLTQEGYTASQINNIMNIGIDITNIAQKIRNNKSELLISQNYDFSNIPRNDYRKFNESQVRFICECLQNHPDMTYIEILINLGYDYYDMDHKQRKKLRDTISTIKRRVSYVEIGNEYNF